MIEIAVQTRLGRFGLDAGFRGPGDGITVLFGPSGAGKSALLGAIAGVVSVAGGRIAINGRTLLDSIVRVHVPAERRRVGWCPQDARLFPSMPVRANLLYGSDRAPRQDGEWPGFDEVVEALGITALLDRRTRDLSGGEAQRVALARAILSRPDLLLLDEPLSALDAPRRLQVLSLLEALRADVGVPMLYVTHAADEVLRLADHLVLIQDGKVVAEGDPIELLTRSGLLTAAMPATVLADGPDPAVTELSADHRTFRVPRLAFPAGERVLLTVAARPLPPGE